MGRPFNPARDIIQKVTDGEISTHDGERLLEEVKARLTDAEFLRARSVIASVRMQAEAEEKAKGVRELFSTGWLHDYLTLGSFTEAPDTFHLFAAMTVLSHLIGRNAYSSYGAAKIYAPLNAFLVSPAGTARRSMVIRLAHDIAYMAGAAIAADTMTPEGLVQILASEPHLMIVVEETANMISKREYQQGLVQNLCSLLDCPSSFERTLRHEKITVENPTVSLLTGCAPNWFRDSMPEAAGAGGLTSRMFMVYEPQSQRLLPFPEDVIPDEMDIDEIKKMLAFQARTIAEDFSGRLEFPPGEVKNMYEAFYNETHELQRTGDDRLGPYYSRRPSHLRRVCLTMLAAEGYSPKLNTDVLDRAITLIKLVEPGIQQIYKQTGMDKPGRLQSRVYKYIEKRGRVKRAQILRAVSDVMTAKELQDVLQTLIEAEAIKTTPISGSNRIDVYYEPL